MQSNGVRNTISITLIPTIAQSTLENPKLASPAPTSPPKSVCDVLLGTAVSTLTSDQSKVAIIVESKNIKPSF